ncbi:pseudaminic acid cytidylyltransferase [Pontibacter arcticus]|uniref:Pseudaminic acid cytidylyltransferase n=1 Tax=Pontibacter arcticus TaxID=2080288 RepID=A0A364RF53_9BACT|nr:pseudaminic acid cytidylyltransferase [Pontibacter arcticus]RAU82970.1 pseudaminic acid cytidylyltransferase [Pontibacter arcticus]
MKRLAIIPARGGSKRIPRKNIKDFCGQPIIAYSIKAALDSGLFDEVMVSTDDEEIAALARKYGASVPFMRSPATSDDFATTAAVLSEVLEKYKQLGYKYEVACCIYPTAPLLQAASLQKAFELLTNKDYDTVIPVLKYSYPIWRSLKLEEGKASMNWPEHVSSRSQDLPSAYHDAGQFYFFRVDSFMQKQALFTDNTGAVELSELQVQDIDTLTDWEMAEIKYKLLPSNV